MAWEQLVSFLKEAADIDRQESQGPPSSCPVDYTPLREGPAGKLFCPWGCGLVWPDDALAWGPFPGSF
jgi:hypothetical protein